MSRSNRPTSEPNSRKIQAETEIDLPVVLDGLQKASGGLVEVGVGVSYGSVIAYWALSPLFE
jgi:hypothetical protein